VQAKQVRDLSPTELDVKLRELEEELFGLQLKRATSQLENPMKLRTVRRNIARLKTVHRERSKVGG
jgi:large subunit ribosomal protein L29